MIKNRKITISEMEYLSGMDMYTPKDDSSKKDVKYELLKSVEKAFGDKWFNLKEGTRQAIDFICFLSVDRGFFYAKPATIAEEHGVSRSTVYEALRLLREYGVIVRTNRTSRKQNGLGSAVHFFTSHPYFSHINSFLKLNWKAHKKADWKAEDAEKPCGSRAESTKKVSTYYLPNIFNLFNPSMNNHYNVPNENIRDSEGYFENEEINSQDAIDSHSNSTHSSSLKWYKYVPRAINAMFATTLQDRLLPLWRRVQSAYKSVKLDCIDKHQVQEIGRSVLRYLVRSKNYVKMTLDEMCAYVYKAVRDALYSVAGHNFIKNMDIVSAEEAYYRDIFGNKVKTFRNFWEYNIGELDENDPRSKMNSIRAMMLGDTQFESHNNGYDSDDEYVKYLKGEIDEPTVDENNHVSDNEYVRYLKGEAKPNANESKSWAEISHANYLKAVEAGVYIDEKGEVCELTGDWGYFNYDDKKKLKDNLW